MHYRLGRLLVLVLVLPIFVPQSTTPKASTPEQGYLSRMDVWGLTGSCSVVVGIIQVFFMV